MMATSSAPAVAIDHLDVVRSGKPILREVSLEVARGSVTGLLGPSGSGKTTLMRAVVGAQRLAGGGVSVLGHPAGAAALRRRVAYVTQTPSVYGDLSVAENLRYFARIVGAPPERVDAVLASVGLGDRGEQVVSSMSGGERARVSLATALLGEPELLVLDEPTVGLDPALRDELWRTFRGIAGDGGTLLVSSHIMEEADECDALLLLRDGALLTADTPVGLRARTGERDLGRAFLHLITGSEVPA